MFRAAACLTTGLALLTLALTPPAGAADPSPPDQTREDAWQRQQPTRERTQRLLEREGIARPPSLGREQLQDLNAISRDLLPPSAPMPAPGVPREPSGAEYPGGPAEKPPGAYPLQGNDATGSDGVTPGTLGPGR